MVVLQPKAGYEPAALTNGRVSYMVGNSGFEPEVKRVIMPVTAETHWGDVSVFDVFAKLRSHGIPYC